MSSPKLHSPPLTLVNCRIKKDFGHCYRQAFQIYRHMNVQEEASSLDTAHEAWHIFRVISGALFQEKHAECVVRWKLFLWSPSNSRKIYGRCTFLSSSVLIHEDFLDFRAFIRRFYPKPLTVINTLIHWWWWLPCEVLTSTSGAVWGSVSCPRTL